MKKGFEMKNIFGTFVVGMLVANVASAASLEDRVSELEANQSLNIFSFSGSLVNRFDAISSKPENADEQSINVNRMKFNFNIDANVSSNLKFYSSIAASKTWNLFLAQNDSGEGSYNDTNSPYQQEIYSNVSGRTSQLVLEKAYFDYMVKSAPLVFSIGRLPTFYGSPVHYWDGRARMGTYPKLSYSTILDGMALTYKAINTESDSLAARVIYTPLSHRNYSPSSSPVSTSQATRYSGAERINSQSVIVTGMLDYTHRGGFADESNLIVQYTKLNAIPIDDPTISGTTYRSNATIENALFTVHGEVTDLLDTGLSMSVSWLQTEALGKGGYYHPTLPVQVGGIFGAADGQDHTIKGSVLLANVNYRLPVDFLNRPVLGVEYQNGSKDSLAYDYVADDMTGFYNNRGDGLHFFYTQKLEDALSLRLGYMDQNQKWAQANITAAPADSVAKFKTMYANLRLDF